MNVSSGFHGCLFAAQHDMWDTVAVSKDNVTSYQVSGKKLFILQVGFRKLSWQ